MFWIRNYSIPGFSPPREEGEESCVSSRSARTADKRVCKNSLPARNATSTKGTFFLLEALCRRFPHTFRGKIEATRSLRQNDCRIINRAKLLFSRWTKICNRIMRKVDDDELYLRLMSYSSITVPSGSRELSIKVGPQMTPSFESKPL